MYCEMIKHYCFPKIRKFVLLSAVTSLITIACFRLNSFEEFLLAVYSGQVPNSNELYIPVILRSMPVILGIAYYGSVFLIEKNAVTMLGFLRYPSRQRWLFSQGVTVISSTFISMNCGIFTALLIGIVSLPADAFQQYLLLLLRLNITYTFGVVWYVLLSNTLCLFMSSKVSNAVSICLFLISDIISSSTSSSIRWSLPSNYIQPVNFSGISIVYPPVFFSLATLLLFMIGKYRIAKRNTL